MRVRLGRYIKLTSRNAVMFFSVVMVAAGVVALIVARQGMAQSCPNGNICAGDPCCGLIENCSLTQLSCQNAGWIWNFTNSTCSNPPTNSSQCDDIGMFWNFTSSGCQDDPPTQIVCEGVEAFWNFTSGACVNAPAIGMCGGGADWGNYISTGCWTGLGLFGGSLCDRSSQFKSKCMMYGDYSAQYCVCTGCDTCGGSPILVDVPGGFKLTDVDHGVRFDLNGNGTPDRLSWTSPTSTAAWLVLDRNRNGYINNGRELFGDFTFQSEPTAAGVEKNGFRALAEWDKAENGGNNDAVITQADDVFSKLRLWRDSNQNGITDPGELRGLWEFGIAKISLDYRESRHRDQFGNEFRYRAKVSGEKDTDLGRWAYDVYLKGAQ